MSLIGAHPSLKSILGDKKTGIAPLWDYAVERMYAFGHTDAVKLLLCASGERLDPSASDNWALGSASMDGYAEVFRLLLADQRVDPSARDNGAV